MFMILDGRDRFYQWDLDRKLIVTDESIDEVHFCNRTDDCSLVCEVYQEGELRLVNVPNILLQKDWRINVYAFDGSYTKVHEVYEVERRTKPADYIYTETEIKNYDDLAARVAQIEENGISDEAIESAVERYLDENDITVDLTGYATEEFVEGRINTIELTPGPAGPEGPAGKDGAPGKDGEPGKDGATGPVGPQGPEGPAGKDGYTPVKGVDYFDGAPGADGQDYVLTEADKKEIAGMVEVTGGGSGEGAEEVYIGTEAPDDANIKIWVDTDEVSNYPNREDIMNTLVPNTYYTMSNGEQKGYSGYRTFSHQRFVKHPENTSSDIQNICHNTAVGFGGYDWPAQFAALHAGCVIYDYTTSGVIKFQLADLQAIGIVGYRHYTSTTSYSTMTFYDNMLSQAQYYYWLNGRYLCSIQYANLKYLPTFFNKFVYDFSSANLSAKTIPDAIIEVAGNSAIIDNKSIIRNESGELKTALPYLKAIDASSRMWAMEGPSSLTYYGDGFYDAAISNLPTDSQAQSFGYNFWVRMVIDGVEYYAQASDNSWSGNVVYIKGTDANSIFSGLIKSASTASLQNLPAGCKKLEVLEFYKNYPLVEDTTKISSDSIVLTSPNGTNFKLTVSDDGALSAVAI